jgi:hypothetical protein
MEIKFNIESAEDAELAADVCTFVAGRLGGYDPETGEVAAGTTTAAAPAKPGRRGGRKPNAEKQRLAEAQAETALKPGAALAGESPESLADALKGSQVVTQQGGVTVLTTGAATEQQVTDMKAKLEGTGGNAGQPGADQQTGTGQPAGGTGSALGDIFAASTPQAQAGAITQGQTAAPTGDLASIFSGAAGGAAAGGGGAAGAAGGGANNDMAALFGKPPGADTSPYDAMSKEDLDKAIYDYVNTVGGMSWGRAALNTLGLRTFNDLTVDQIRSLLKDPKQVKVS